jgi:lipopolysaccharide export system permease protein
MSNYRILTQKAVKPVQGIQMPKLQKYILLQMLPSFLAVTVGLSVLAILTQSLTQLDLLIERGQSPFTLLTISLLATPQFMAIVSPIALFATAVTVYSRLYTENEIVVSYSAGQSIWQLLLPLVYLSAMVTVVILLINIFVQPFTHRLMREKLYSIRTDLATTLVREGQFRQPVPGLTVYTRKIVRDGGMRGLVVSDSRTPIGAITYVAKEGSIVKLNGIPSISMLDGSVHRMTDKGAVELLGFSQYVLELEGFVAENAPIFYKPMERYTKELFDSNRVSEWDRTHSGELLAEGHRRLASPLNSIAAAILGGLAILGSAYSRGGYSAGIYKTAIWLMLLLLFQSASQSLIEENPWANILAYLVPILVSMFALFRLRVFDNFTKYFDGKSELQIPKNGLISK